MSSKSKRNKSKVELRQLQRLQASGSTRTAAATKRVAQARIDAVASEFDSTREVAGEMLARRGVELDLDDAMLAANQLDRLSTGERPRIPTTQVAGVTVPKRSKATRGMLAIVCDLCSSTEPTWRYPVRPWRDSLTGEVYPRSQLVMRGYNTGLRSDGNAWYACDRCSDLVERGRQSELATLGVEASRRAYGDPQREGVTHEEMMHALRSKVADFMAHRDGPRQPWKPGGGVFEQTFAPLPDVGPYSDALVAQLRLRDWWRTPRALDTILGAHIDGGRNHLAPDVLRGFTAFAANTLERAVTYYVSPPIASFLGQSAESVPSDAVFALEDLPAPSGFLYLAEPLETPCTDPAGHQEHPGDPVDKPRGALLHSPAYHRVRAISWSMEPDDGDGHIRVTVDPRLGPDDAAFRVDDDAERSVGRIFIYVDSRAGEPVFRDHFTWPVGSRVDSTLRKIGAVGYTDLMDPREDVRQIIDPVRKLLVAAWAFISQQLADEAQRPPNNLTRKQLERAGQHRDTYRPIRIVYLRREGHAGKAKAQRASAGEREYHVLWMRRMHKRMVPYGPRDQEPRPKRLKWIKASICGPADRSKWEGLELKPSRAIYAVVK